MENGNEVYAEDRKQWREWLRKNGGKATEVWLVYYKKHTRKPSVAYEEAVEEAICFGWIDGQVRTIDGERYMQRYSPRTPRSSWSQSNIARANRMIEQGKMTKRGLAAFEDAMANDRVIPSSKEFSLPEGLKKALRKNPEAWKNYNALAPSTQLTYTYWVDNAKREETRTKRIEKSVELLALDKRLGQ